MAFDSTVSIEELTGDKRLLVLGGSALPKQGVPFGVKQRVITKFNSGSRDAVQHVLGPTETQAQWAGVWRSTQLARNPVRLRQDGSDTFITRAVTVARVFENIVRSGQRVRVTWSQAVFSQGVADGNERIVRLGLCSDFQPNFTRMDDLEWTATWDWSGRGEAEQTVTSVKNDDLGSVVQGALQQLRALVDLIQKNAIKTATEAATSSPSTFSLGDLEALANAPTEFFNSLFNACTLAISGITEVAGLLETIVMQPANVASRAVDTAEAAASTIVNIVETFTRTIPDAYASVADRPALLISIVSYFDDVEAQAEKASGACTDLATVMRRQVSRHLLATAQKKDGAPDILAVYIPKQGQTFTIISWLFFTVPDYAGDIAFANGYDSWATTPEPGGVLIIPTLKALQQSQQKF